MKNRILVGFLALTLLAGAGVRGALAQEKAKNEVVTKTGVIEITKADAKKNEKYDTILLKVDKESFKLLPGSDKKAFAPLAKLNGKTVTVTGELLPANPPKYPLAAIKVAAVTKAATAKAAAPAAPVKK